MNTELMSGPISVSLGAEGKQHAWYAVRTRTNFEKATSTALINKGFSPYLPTYRSRRRWSDRVVELEFPLFGGYLFCRFDPRAKLPILSTVGVIGIVSFGSEPAAISDSEITAVQTVLSSGLGAEPCPFLHEGQRVRVRHGALSGLEGILTKKKTDSRIVFSVSMLQRSISVEIDDAWVTAA